MLQIKPVAKLKSSREKHAIRYELMPYCLLPLSVLDYVISYHMLDKEY